MPAQKKSAKQSGSAKPSAKVKDMKPKKDAKGGGMIKSVEISNLKSR